MKIGEVIQEINNPQSFVRVSRALQLEPVNLAKVLTTVGYTYQENQWVWKQKRKPPVDGNVEDYLIQVFGMRIGELLKRLEQGESLKSIGEMLGVSDSLISKILKLLGFVEEKGGWIWRGHGRPPLGNNILDFVVYRKPLWQRLLLWSIPLVLIGGLLAGFYYTVRGEAKGDFLAYKAEASLIKNRFGKDHVLLKHNGDYYLLAAQGPLLSNVQGDYVKVLVYKNEYGSVWYKIHNE